MTEPMNVILVTREHDGVERLISFMTMIVESSEHVMPLEIRVAIDPADNGVKFSVDGGTWSPPARGTIVTPPPRPISATRDEMAAREYLTRGE